MQDVYDKEVLHRIVGVPPKATVTQEDPQLRDSVHSKRGGASIVQSAWEPAERSQEAEDDGYARKRESSTTTLSREVIDIDPDEESRYEIARRKRRRTKEVIDAETVFTEDEGSEDDVIVVESSEEEERKGGGQVKINRKRAFWASKAGTAESLGT